MKKASFARWMLGCACSLCNIACLNEQLASTSTLLGLFREWDCAIGEQELSPGDVLALYTDGITEARNERGEEFGRGVPD